MAAKRDNPFARITFAREIAESYWHGARVVEIHEQFCPNRHGCCMCQYRGTLASREQARHEARMADDWTMRAYWLGIARHR
jgi:hypothetical protein